MIPINSTTILVALLAVASATTWWYRTQAVGLEEQVTVLEEQAVRLEGVITKQNEISIDHYRKYQEQLVANDALARESSEKTRTINKYKSREHIVYAKPGLVEKLEQKALDKFFKEVSDD